MFIFLDEKRKKFSQWLKIKTTMDFSDWGVFLLFVSGLSAIIYFGKNMELANKISVIVLWFTAIIIMQYTKETHWLKVISGEQLGTLRKKASLGVEFENRRPFCRVTNVSNDPRGNARRINSYHIRLRIENNNDIIARQCEVKLISIMNENQKIRKDFDPVVLDWVGTGLNPININCGEFEYIDLVTTIEDENYITVEAEDKTPRGINFHPKRDNYYFKVGIYGENVIAKELVFKFINNQFFDKVRLEKT